MSTEKRRPKKQPEFIEPPPEVIDTTQKLDEWIERSYIRFRGIRGLLRGAAGTDDISDIIRECYDKAIDYANELVRKGPTLSVPPSIEYNPLLGLRKLQRWCLKCQKQKAAQIK